MKRKKTVRTKIFLHDCMQGIINRLQDEKKYASVHTYGSTLNSVSRFWIETGRATDGRETGNTFIPVHELFTPGCLKEYQEWIRSHDGSWNTVSTYMRTLRAVYNRILPMDGTDNPHFHKLFAGIYTQVIPRTKRSLNTERMNDILHADRYSLPESLRLPLDYFCLMFLFRGMPFIDLAYLRKQDVNGDEIVYCRHKTGRQLSVHIPREARRLFDRCRDRNTDSGYLFPILSSPDKDRSPDHDAHLHECYLQALRHFNRSLQQLSVLLTPGAKLSSYTPRHTWATLAFHSGIPVGVISKALGHSSVRVTETYLKPFENSKVDAANYELINSVMKYKKRKNDLGNSCFTAL